VDDFRAGWQNVPPPERLPRGATPDAANCWFEHFGPGGATLAKRPGARHVASCAAQSALVEFTREGFAPVLIAVGGGYTRIVPLEGSLPELIPGAEGFSLTRPTRAVSWKDYLLLMDGVQMRRCTVTAAYPVGVAPPTGAPLLTQGASPGVSGTYEGYAVWYDSATDHESSPSATSSAVACSNQARAWTKPTGTPPSNVTHWRLYVRRVDTAELNFYRVATVPIATNSTSESVSDLARTDLGPEPAVNDVPPAFALMAVHRGYGLAATVDSGDLHISKLNDLESWHPKDVFPISRDGEPITAIVRFGGSVLVFKATSTYRLVGEQPPFAIEVVHSQWGAASQEAVVEVDGRIVAWDARRGPYWTDTTSWTSLIEGRVRFDQVAHGDAWRVRVVHDIAHALLCFFVPLVTASGAVRLRQILAYHYHLDAWLPPIFGLAYATATTFREADGTVALMVGDESGQVFEYFTGDSEGAWWDGPTTATVVSATETTIAVTPGAFQAAAAAPGANGLPLLITSPAGETQLRRVETIHASGVVLAATDGGCSPVPQAGWTVTVGPILWHWWSGVVDYDAPGTRKLARWLMLQLGAASTAHVVTVDLRFDETVGLDVRRQYTVPLTGAVWGTGVWDTAAWGAVPVVRATRKARLHRAFQTCQLRLSNSEPHQPIYVSALSLGVDGLPRRQVPSRG
jgi:hypothetical protein